MCFKCGWNVGSVRILKEIHFRLSISSTLVNLCIEKTPKLHFKHKFNGQAWNGTGLIQIPVLRRWRRLRAPMFESPTQEGASLGANPPERTGKTEGFEYSLDFWYFLFQKGTHSFANFN